MYSETRKKHLIKEMLKGKNESVLIEIEAILKRTKSGSEQKLSAHDFVGLFSGKDAEIMNKAIEEGCSFFRD